MNNEKSSYRAAAGLAIAGAFLLFWVTGAVGIIGNEGNPANFMYLGVLAIGILGSLITRLKARGMSRVLFAMAIAQFLVPVIALIIWRPEVDYWGAAGMGGVFLLNAAFALIFAGSALAVFEDSPGTGFRGSLNLPETVAINTKFCCGHYD